MLAPLGRRQAESINLPADIASSGGDEVVGWDSGPHELSHHVITAPPEQGLRRMTQYVYFFGGGKADGRADMKNQLGGKGANLAEMANLGLPVPAGFTLVTDYCNVYLQQG